MIIDLCVIHGGTIHPVVLGNLIFRASPDHAVVTDYTANVRAAGDSTIVAAIDLAKPQPDEDDLIVVNIAGQLNALSPGNYEVKVQATSPGGTVESPVSNAFTVPLV
jgi:hypothetical protein